jgi:hypothetical protein
MVRRKRVARKRVNAREQRVRNPGRRDVGILVALILVLAVFIFVKDYSGVYNQGTGQYSVADRDSFYKNEKWIASCNNEKSAEDTVNEILKFNYDCKNYCYQIAHGITLPGNNVGQLDCRNSNERMQWVAWCEGYHNIICG